MEVLQGAAMTVKEPYSDVILHVPSGVHGILYGMIHTDHSQFADLVPDEDCIVGPTYECHIQYKPGYGPPKEPFLLQIPHIVDNIYDADIGVQVQRDQNGMPQDALKAGECPHNLATAAKVFYSIKGNHVDIFTREFSKFSLKAKANCCCNEINLAVFSKMIPPSTTGPGEPLPEADIRVYLSSKTAKIKDYARVMPTLFLQNRLIKGHKIASGSR